jgi:hypothetical protein
MNYNCDICNKNFKTNSGLWKHIKNIHNTELDQTDQVKQYKRTEQVKDFNCKFCNKNFSFNQSKWSHEQKCKTKNTLTLEEQVKMLSQKIKEIESKPSNTNTTNNTTNNNTTNNTTNNIQYIINAPGKESLSHLTFEDQKLIMNKGLNSLTQLIELVNFNKKVPENHSYCVTSLNDKHASVIDDKTNSVIKTAKSDLFDKILVTNLNNLEKCCENKKLNKQERDEFMSKINELRSILFQNRKYMKRYRNDINLISYNNKDIILDTWKCLKEQSKKIYNDQDNKTDNFFISNNDYLNELSSDDSDDYDTEENESSLNSMNKLKEHYKVNKPNLIPTNSNLNKTKKTNKPVTSNSKQIIVINEYSDSETEEESDNFVEIIFKGKTYILEGINVYNKTQQGQKADFYGTFSNGKIKKHQQNNIEL